MVYSRQFNIETEVDITGIDIYKKGKLPESRPTLTPSQIRSIGREGLSSEVLVENPEVEVIDESELKETDSQEMLFRIIDDDTITNLARLALYPEYFDSQIQFN